MELSENRLIYIYNMHTIWSTILYSHTAPLKFMKSLCLWDRKYFGVFLFVLFFSCIRCLIARAHKYLRTADRCLVFHPLLQFGCHLCCNAVNSSLTEHFKMATISPWWFTDDIFKCIFMCEKFGISIQISLKFVPKVPIDNKSALVQVMAWHGTGDKPLFEPMLTQFFYEYMWH